MRKEFKIGLFLVLGLVLVISIHLCTRKSMSVESRTLQLTQHLTGSNQSPIGANASSRTPAKVGASAVAAALDANAPLTDLQPVIKTTADLTKFEQSEPIKTQHFYIVREGDVLSYISQKFYGTARKVNQIYEANHNIIKDKNLLRPGMKLIIPL